MKESVTPSSGRNGGSPPVIRHGTQDAHRLVENDITARRIGDDAVSVDPDDYSRWVELDPLSRHCLAVDADPALADQVLTVSAGAHAGIRQHPLQPN
jgi:hypothetical protein